MVTVTFQWFAKDSLQIAIGVVHEAAEGGRLATDPATPRIATSPDRIRAYGS
jgi:hypothetical protein